MCCVTGGQMYQLRLKALFILAVFIEFHPEEFIKLSMMCLNKLDKQL